MYSDDNQQVVVAHGFDQHTHPLEFDHIVFALGCVTNFYQIPKLAETALTMKTLGDAVALRNRLIEKLEEAGPACAVDHRESLVNFVVAGAGFAGTAPHPLLEQLALAKERNRQTDSPTGPCVVNSARDLQ